MILYCLILNISRSDVGVSLNFQKNAEFLDIGQVNPWKRFIIQKSIPLYLKKIQGVDLDMKKRTSDFKEL